jgi:hypothetical protein
MEDVCPPRWLLQRLYPETTAVYASPKVVTVKVKIDWMS